ncbi:AAA family ATPase [Baekduia soli]|uniref:AAA family ATPase n=1 Tax=Baekduia soli TaxID=496014 RepID=A0A5B8U3B3_9ACTN|nr:helix-turn-helix transcriptional regulator [Baekduia soli]QEC47549.1 AAA family ATPase [Baekduia soli]
MRAGGRPQISDDAPGTAADAGLLERAEALATLQNLLDGVRAGGAGRLVLVGGEAGIGKSALVRAFCAASGPGTRVLWGGCDALSTPRALGPLLDIAHATGGGLAAAVARDAAPGTVAAALAGELEPGPAIVVLEDLHWADEATLDVLRLLARRVAAWPALVVATYRADELHAAHPLRLALGDLPAQGAHRLDLGPLSVHAVGVLAGAVGVVDVARLHERTAGNPFFVTEVLAAEGAGDLPDTVRDAVLARAARLGDAAREVLDAVAIEPARTELWLLETLADGAGAGLDACLATGMLRAEGTRVGFRHEIARVAIEEALAPHRRLLLHRRALAALTAALGRRPDPARLAAHAEAADDAEAVLRFAPAAASRAAALGSHREAAAQLARALRYADGLPPARRAELLGRRSYECYLTDAIPEAVQARTLALAEHRAAGDVAGEGDAHRWLSRLAWFGGDNATAEAQAQRAIALLEPLEPGPELAMAYSNVAQLRMLTGEDAAAIAWGARAIALAERLGEQETLAHALNNVGVAELRSGAPGGAATLERSLALALAGGLEEHVARAYTNLSSCAVERRDFARADRAHDDGIAYCRERGLDAWLWYMSGYRARSDLDQGRWDAAARGAAEVLAQPRVAATSRFSALVVAGRLAARRGEAGHWPALDEALELARRTGELQRLGPVAVARAEARWLGGEPAAVEDETAATLALALRRGDPWVAGELAVWRRRAGLEPAPGPAAGALAEPCRLELDGDHRAAAEAWAQVGCPFEAALALTHAGDEASQREALEALQGLGAAAAAARVARRLRERGARGLRRGPHPATRENPAGLTARELEVVELLADGLRNAEIAERLWLSQRTVGHHVSAILRKLDATSRSQAAATALRLRIVER